MRRPERIPIILDLFLENPDALKAFTGLEDISDILSNWDKVEDYWIVGPDLRFGQMLINLGLIPDGQAWNTEEVHWLITNNYLKPEEILFWGKNFEADGNRLDKTQWILLKNLTTDHIKGIIKYFGDHYNTVSPLYRNYFDKRVKEEV